MGCLQSRNEKLIEEQQEQAAMKEQDKNNNLDLVSCSMSESESQAKSTNRISIEECRNSFNKSIDMMQDINKKLEAFSGDDSDLSVNELQ